MNLTDAESRIMPRSGGGGFEQSFNAQAAVDADSRLVVATNVVNTPVDAKQVQPMLERLAQLPEELGKADKLLTDAGFFSAANVEHCERQEIVPYLARRRDQHYVPWYERSSSLEPLPADGECPISCVLSHTLPGRVGGLYGEERSRDVFQGVVGSVAGGT